ncbi:MAG TPA: chromosome segregation protein SMC [Tepidisphaeraceae bacterium]
MRLKKLIVQGFKSFADRTEFVFDSPITGIVGPNGCGKSNVVDAFKWVLGEQSAKSLRGDAMMDVIFNGSGGRKPSGMAEVALVFENPLRADGTRLLNLDAEEVSVGRRLFRDGTSEYQLNTATSRLKDVRELFLDTGVGVDAYSVIEQGRVSALLEANPEERRLIFEEAAGISKFKQRKKESQRKLEKVDQNLLRVNDIVEEVDKRLRSVKIQAGRARTYQEYSERLGELRLAYALREYHTHRGQLTELETGSQDAQFRLDDAAGNLVHKQNELAAKREEFEAFSQKRQQVEYELVQAKAAMQSARQRQDYARQQLEQIAEQIAAFEQDRANVAAKLAEVTSAMEGESTALARLTEELEANRQQIEQRQRAFADGQLRLASINKEIEQHKSAILDLMRKLAQVNSRLGHIEIERKNIASQQTRLSERRQVVVGELETLEGQRAQFQQELDGTLVLMTEQQNALENSRADAQKLGQQLAQISEQHGAAKEHRSGLLSRQKLLKDLEVKREGVSEGVKSVLRQREATFPFIRGLVADVLRVDVEHAHVIEAALDGRDQWLVTNELAAAAGAREALAVLEGRVNILSIDRVPLDFPEDVYDWNQHSHGIRLAIDLVRFDPSDRPLAQHVLGRTSIADDLTIARELHESGPRGWRYVTKMGEVLEADGTLRAGPLTASMGLLSRRSELEAIEQQVAEVDGRIAQLAEQISHGSTAAKALEEQQNAQRNEVYRLSTIKVEATSRIARNNDQQNSLRREQPVLDRELQQMLEQIGKLKTEDTKLSEQRQQMEADQAGRQQQVTDLTAGNAQLADDIRQMSEELTATRVMLGQVQEKQLAARQQVQRHTAALAELKQQAERLERSERTVAERRGGVETELEAAGAAEAALVATQEALAAQIEKLTGQVSESGEAVRSMTGQVDGLRGEHAEIEQELHGLQLRLSELKVRLETLVGRTMEELSLDLPAKYESLNSEGGEGYQPAEMDWDAVADEIKQLRDKIHRLGNVNLDAIGEQDELEQRSQFLTGQVTDLTSSKLQLEQLIEEINRESGIRFEQTFNAVREHFQGMFRKLFGGGKADIYLETELEDKRKPEIGPDGLPVLFEKKKVDILDAGIEIIARPPGKQPVSISQLSGGEKTMTCVALLMSIFKSKPSPFCILDEVDAALDEANNQRFNLIVQEFLEQSQFIIITHSKRTMQIADVLYGVTMQEQGVSKRVAVKFDQVDSQGRINETAAA